MKQTGLALWAGAVALALGAWGAGVAKAEDLAIIVSNTDYRRLPDVVSDLAPSDLSEALDEAGFEVLVLSNGTAARMQDRFSERLGDLEASDRLVVVLVGHVVTDGRESWLLGIDARRPDLFNAGAQGLRISALMPVLGGRPGDAALFVAPAPDTRDLGPGLTPGFLPGLIPQGVTVVEGPENEIVSLIVDDLLRAGLPAGLAVDGRGGALVGYGYLPGRGAFVPLDPSVAANAEAEAWAEADRQNTVEAYRAYLARFPSGANRVTAVERIAGLRLGPAARAEQEEEALALNRDARREIQRNLSILGHDPRGIDGIFGPGTRAAVRSWQGSESLEVTGFLSGNQVARLQEAAARRQAELEAEARRRQEEADREDTAFWREVGRGENEAGLREYLSRYPDGLFSGLARGRLNEIEEARRASAASAERSEWQAAEAEGTVDAYRRYLQSYPNGAFADDARARIFALRAPAGDQAASEAARNEEAGVLANPITRLLVERRLRQLDLDPGAVDGTFDDDTRRAIRRYQRARDLPVSGYVTQDTLVRMLGGN